MTIWAIPGFLVSGAHSPWLALQIRLTGSPAQAAVMPNGSRHGGSLSSGAENLIPGMPSQHEKVSCGAGFAWVGRLFRRGSGFFGAPWWWRPGSALPFRVKVPGIDCG